MDMKVLHVLKSLRPHQVHKCLDYFTYNKKYDSNDVILYVNSLLEDDEDYNELALQLVNFVLNHFSRNALISKGINWMDLVFKNYNKTQILQNDVLLFNTIRKLAQQSQLSADLTNNFKNYLLKVYTSLIHVSTTGRLSALQCVETLLRLFTKDSKPYIELILQFLKQNDSSLENIYWQAKCHFHLQFSEKNISASNYRYKWKEYHLHFVDNIQLIISVMFSTLSRFTYPLENQKIFLEKFANDSVHRSFQLYDELVTVAQQLIITLSEPFAAEKSIVVNKLLNVLSSGLNLTGNMLEQMPGYDCYALKVLLPKVHLILMEVLQAMIKILGSHMRMMYQTFLKFIVNSLQWTDGKTNSSIMQIRKITYDILSLWTQSLRTGSKCEIIFEFLVMHIFKDIELLTGISNFEVVSVSSKYSGQRENNQSSLQTHSYSETNEILRNGKLNEANISALLCLQNVILSSSNMIKPTTIEFMQQKTIKLLGNYRNTRLLNNQNEMELLKLLYILFVHNHKLCVTPYEMIYKLFQSSKFEDKARTFEVLSLIENITHFQKGSLLFPNNRFQNKNSFQHSKYINAPQAEQDMDVTYKSRFAENGEIENEVNRSSENFESNKTENISLNLNSNSINDLAADNVIEDFFTYSNSTIDDFSQKKCFTRKCDHILFKQSDYHGNQELETLDDKTRKTGFGTEKLELKKLQNNYTTASDSDILFHIQSDFVDELSIQ